jgi:hypothetical protein
VIVELIDLVTLTEQRQFAHVKLHLACLSPACDSLALSGLCLV